MIHVDDKVASLECRDRFDRRPLFEPTIPALAPVSTVDFVVVENGNAPFGKDETGLQSTHLDGQHGRAVLQQLLHARLLSRALTQQNQIKVIPPESRQVLFQNR